MGLDFGRLPGFDDVIISAALVRMGLSLVNGSSFSSIPSSSPPSSLPSPRCRCFLPSAFCALSSALPSLSPNHAFASLPFISPMLGKSKSSSLLLWTAAAASAAATRSASTACCAALAAAVLACSADAWAAAAASATACRNDSCVCLMVLGSGCSALSGLASLAAAWAARTSLGRNSAKKAPAAGQQGSWGCQQSAVMSRADYRSCCCCCADPNTPGLSASMHSSSPGSSGKTFLSIAAATGVCLQHNNKSTAELLLHSQQQGVPTSNA